MRVVDSLGCVIKKDDIVVFRHGNKHLKGVIVSFVDESTVLILVKPNIKEKINLLDCGLYTIKSKNTLSKMIENKPFYHLILK